MSTYVRSCCTAVALTTSIATTLTFTGPASPSVTRPAIREYESVKLPLVALAGLEAKISAAAANAPRPANGRVNQVAATAAASGGDVLYDLVRNVAIAASYLLEPLWLIAFPITFPLGYLIASAIFPPDPISGGTRVLTAILAGPAAIVAFLFPQRSASAGAVRPTSSRSSATIATAVAGPVASRDSGGDQPTGRPAANSKQSLKPAAKAKVSRTASKRSAIR